MSSEPTNRLQVPDDGEETIEESSTVDEDEKEHNEPSADSTAENVPNQAFDSIKVVSEDLKNEEVADIKSVEVSVQPDSEPNQIQVRLKGTASVILSYSHYWQDTL